MEPASDGVGPNVGGERREVVDIDVGVIAKLPCMALREDDLEGWCGSYLGRGGVRAASFSSGTRGARASRGRELDGSLLLCPELSREGGMSVNECSIFSRRLRSPAPRGGSDRRRREEDWASVSDSIREGIEGEDVSQMAEESDICCERRDRGWEGL